MYRLLIVFATVVGCEQTEGWYTNAQPGACGRITVGGNVVVPYGIEPVECESFEKALAVALGDGRAVVRSSYCWLVGEGENARFVGGCSVPDDQYYYPGSFCRPAAGPDWIVPDSIGDSMTPVRNDAGEFVANIFVGDYENLQLRLIREGVARVSCTPTTAGDTCYRLQDME